jgi:cation transport ATPase
MSDNLDRLPILINLSFKTIQTINRNIGIAFSYSAVVLFLSFLGFIPPILAALIHNGGALLVLLNSGGLLKHNYRGLMPEMQRLSARRKQRRAGS